MSYSAFNSWKALLHRDRLKAIAEDNFMPPYWCCVDPTNCCNHKCSYCNSPYHKLQRDFISRDHLLKIAAFIRDWGLMSVIVEGGGEPLMNLDTPEFIRKCKEYDIEVGLITNGSLLDESISTNLIENARFCGISFDAATTETYQKIRGVDHFSRTIENIEYLNNLRIKTNSKLDVNMKFLINSINYTEIVEFTKLAKKIGCSGVHIKPVAVDNIPGVDRTLEINQSSQWYLENLLKEAESEATDNFNVQIVLYKFDSNLRRTVRFDKCTCTPLGGVFGADGNFWMCFNMRGTDGFKLCSHYPDPYEVKRIWNTKYHKDLINNIDPNKCMRCGLTQYNEIVEKVIKQDQMYWKFP